jgi:hypothetical protein
MLRPCFELSERPCCKVSKLSRPVPSCPVIFEELPSPPSVCHRPSVVISFTTHFSAPAPSISTVAENRASSPLAGTCGPAYTSPPLRQQPPSPPSQRLTTSTTALPSPATNRQPHNRQPRSRQPHNRQPRRPGASRCRAPPVRYSTPCCRRYSTVLLTLQHCAADATALCC